MSPTANSPASTSLDTDDRSLRYLPSSAPPARTSRADAHPGGDHRRELAREHGKFDRLTLFRGEADLARGVLVGDVEHHQPALLELICRGPAGICFDLPAAFRRRGGRIA